MSLRLREKLLALLSPSEEKPSLVKVPTPIITVCAEAVERKREEEKTPAPNNNALVCPNCGIPLVEVASGIARCQQCGFQARPAPKPASIPPVIRKRAASPGECPSCRSTLLTEIGGGWRCQQCGHQIVEGHATGLSRKEIENYEGKPAHLQMNSTAFYRALGRMRAFGGR